MYQDNKNVPKKLQIWLPLLFALVLVAGMLIGMKIKSPGPAVIVDVTENNQLVAPGQGKIEELLRYIEAKYVDKVDRDKLVQEAIDEVLKNLDPHSNYITAKQLKEVNESLEGNFDGIGVEFMILDDTIIVVAPLAGGPSEAVGVKAGDKIIAIEDSIIAGRNIENKDVVQLLRGEKGTKVNIGIKRGSEDKLRRFTITRDKIPMHSVDIAYMLDEKTGYIKINRFSATTHDEFMKGLEKLVEEKNMKDLIIDLRRNPGGYLPQATNILSQLFQNKDKLLVYTEGRTVHRHNYESTGRAYFPIEDIAVLIDEGSASASEILAGAIQDHDRGIIIGRRSFGKGLVQEQYRLRDGSALRLTVARYYTPSGRSIQKNYSDLEAYDNDMFDRYESGELYSEDKIPVIDSTRYYTSKGRVVYGGGGISPDVFVPLDTIFHNEYFLDLRQHIPEFVYLFMEKEKTALNEYPLDKFRNDYEVPKSVFNEFLGYAAEKGVDTNWEKLKECDAEIRLFLKAIMAKHLFEDEGFYTVWNTQDVMINKALKVLQSPNPISSTK